MKYSIKRIILAVAFAAPLFVFGSAYEVYKTDVPLSWPVGFHKAIDQATQTGRPLVMIWSQYGCDYCNHLKTAIAESAEFIKWKESCGYDFLCVEGNKTAESKAAFNFAINAGGKQPGLNSFPFVVLIRYDNGELSATNFVGRLPAYVSSNSSRASINQDKAALAQMVMDSADCYFVPRADFVCGDAENDRLEVYAGAKSVLVPLKRSARTDIGSVNYLNDVEVRWEPNETEKYVEVDGNVRELVLKDADGNEIATRTIAEVENSENNPKNPLWIGERDEETLKPGEWTMDYGLVLSKVKSTKESLALTLVGGSLWCPDCVNTDKYLIDTDVFRKWTETNRIYCAAIDEPRFAKGVSVPTLLSYEGYSKSNKDGTVTVTSGAGYLSRKGADPELAAQLLERNLNLATNDVFHGGLTPPEHMDPANTETAMWKLGIPCMVMQDGIGHIYGRLYQFTMVSPTSSENAEAYVQRLRELYDLAFVGDMTEEVNRHWLTAKTDVCKLSIEDGKTKKSWISAIDTVDFWWLDGRSSWLRTTFTVQGDGGAAEGDNVALKLYRIQPGDDYAVKPVRTVTGNLRTGLTLADCEIPPEDGDDYFLKIEALDTSDDFILTHKGDSTVGYVITVASAADPGEAAFTEEGKKATEAAAKKAGGSLVVYAPMERTGGASGELAVTVEVDEATTAFPDRYAIDEPTVVWADGERGTKSVAVRVLDDANADGTQQLVLRAGESRWTLTIEDNDKTTVGKVSFAAAEPAIAKKPNVYALEGSTLRIGASRINGASGDVAAEVKVGAEVVTNFSWRSRESGLKWVETQLPTLEECAAGKLTVTFGKLTGITADSSTKSLTVNLISEAAPYFVEEDVVLGSLARYCAFERTVAVEQVAEGAKLALTKLSGAIPTGVTVKLVGSEVIIAGTPTKAQTCEAVYQISETVNKKKIPGRTCRLAFTVTDVAKLDPADPGANPAIAKARSFGDMMVVDDVSRKLTGVLTGLSLPVTGKASAKYKCAAGTIALSAAAWSDYDPADGTVIARMTAAKTGHAVEVTVPKSGEVTLKLTDPDAGEGPIAVTPSAAWDAKKNPATRWQGAYVLAFDGIDREKTSANALASGSPYATLKMTGSAAGKGTMTYAGVLASGQSFSGSGTLVADALGETSELPIYYRTAKDFFTAVPEIKAGAAVQAVESSSKALPFWRHVETATDEGSFDVGYVQIYGSYYDVKLTDLTTTVDPDATGHELLAGDPASTLFAPIPVEITAKAVTLDAAAAKPLAAKISFAKATGIVSGSFKTLNSAGKSVSATFKGVILPDWGDGCPVCGGTPWAIGSYWFADQLDYELKGKAKKLSVKCGDRIAVGAVQP